MVVLAIDALENRNSYSGKPFYKIKQNKQDSILYFVISN